MWCLPLVAFAIFATFAIVPLIVTIPAAIVPPLPAHRERAGVRAYLTATVAESR
jgi:hypothetical protein